MSTDLTFITNEEGNKLADRFSTLIKHSRLFDCLVGYFYVTGFCSLYKSLEEAEKIRILVGISTDSNTFGLIQESKEESLQLSHKETKDLFSTQVIRELSGSDESLNVEEGINKFIEWIKAKPPRLEIHVYPTEKIHAKLYILTFKDGEMDKGRVITGSSNFTRSGLRENLEFNVELKNRSDYEFALTKFNDLWNNSIDVTEKYVETVKTKTWLNDSITPYELYLKFLYEYLKEKINIDQTEIFYDYTPDKFMKLEYQKDAVRDAKAKLEEYGGVFISDVVGLGKTYIAAMLSNQLDGRHLVIAPPHLLDEDDPGSWRCVFSDFGVRQTDFESIGKLDKVLERGTEKYRNVFIDEAHRFRNETTQMYEDLARICKGKRVILVSATPLNNTPMDILSQIKLFQNAHNSTLPNPKVRDLEGYFTKLQRKLSGLDRQKDKDQYVKIVQENAKDIRENVLQYLMVRRTRTSISKYYKKDLEKQKLRFPDVGDPKPCIYNFDEELDKVFNKTVEYIVRDFKYARYTPLLYIKEELTKMEETSQRNMGKFMRILLLKRLESSFYAFRKSIERFIASYDKFIGEYEKGNVYVSKKHINKIFELLEKDDMEAIQKLIDAEKAETYSASSFTPDFITDLKKDLSLLKKIQGMWNGIENDPKLDKFVNMLSNDEILKKNKVLVFTESKETAEYLENSLDPKFGKLIAFSSASGEGAKNVIRDNFDARARHPKDEYKILVSTEILAEGVNLHRSNVVVNYDIPWNTTRMMQRVGRINRVDTKFDKIYTYNFFPAGPINENIGLKELAEAKIKQFIEMLGNDARLLTDEEIKSHDLFSRLNSKKTITGEDEEDDPELGLLTYLRDIRDNDKDLFEKIKKLPKKARTGRKQNQDCDLVITFFRKGKLRKLFQTKGDYAEEIDFLKAASLLKAEKSTKKEKLGPDFYKFYEKNKKEFDAVFAVDGIDMRHTGGSNNEARIMKTIKAVMNASEFTEDDEEFLQKVMKLLGEAGLPKETSKNLAQELKGEINPLKILGKIKVGIPIELFRESVVTNAANVSGPKETILSEYLVKGE